MKLCTLLPLASLVLFVAPALTTAQSVPTAPGLPNVFNPASQVPGTAGMTPAQAQRAQQVWQLQLACCAQNIPHLAQAGPLHSQFREAISYTHAMPADSPELYMPLQRKGLVRGHAPLMTPNP